MRLALWFEIGDRAAAWLAWEETQDERGLALTLGAELVKARRYDFLIGAA